MGTSSRWPGPGGRTDLGREWSRLGGRTSKWQPDTPDADAKLDEIAEEHLQVLHRTLRKDPTAFGLYEAVCAAGERLTGAVPDIWAAEPPGVDALGFAALLTSCVGGEGGTMADAAVRRAVASSATRLGRSLEQGSVGGAPVGGDLSGELFCMLYQWFFADTVAEFLRSAIAEKVKLAAPLLPAFDPEDCIADWIGEQVLRLLPSPCEEAESLAEATERAEDIASVAEDPLTALRLVARGLVPRAAGQALGLISGGPDEETDGTSYDTYGSCQGGTAT